ncbi:uncharacterized protein [Onthophagus taurus]|uniref:uncharacterized protein n=1 Tax=Onthophagus taurus TaxID=166361 RepID=UPI000C207C1F|nr:uncharacterized protein LOC111426908 [Onthophagus taurus]
MTSLKPESYTSTESIRKQYFRNRNRSKPPKVQITTTSVNRFIETVGMTDQASDSSNQQLNNKDTEPPLTINEVNRAVNRSKQPQQGPLKLTLFPRDETIPRNKGRKTTIVVTTTPKIMNPTVKTKTRLENVTPSQLVKTIKPLKYDYFENFSGILKSIPEHSKVLIDDNGIIHCLDQGNFPHPVSCKKFISCARMEGRVLGWEYTCPKNLSFDPIGGLCNWSADLGCDE